MPIDVKSMDIGELYALQAHISTELKMRQNELFESKCRALVDAIEDLRDAFPHTSWEIEYETEDGEWQTLDLLWKYTPSGLVSCISR
jgi:SHS2 domain-containing protein